MHWQMLLWQASVIGYLSGVFATALLPVPEFVIDAAAREAGGFGGGGVGQAKPQTVIAFGFFYFGWLPYQKSVRLAYAEDLPAEKQVLAK